MRYSKGNVEENTLKNECRGWDSNVEHRAKLMHNVG